MKTLNHLGMTTLNDCILTDEVKVCDVLPIAKYGEPQLQFHPAEVEEGMKSIDALIEEYLEEGELEKVKEMYDPRLFIRWKRDIDYNSHFYKILNDEEKAFIATLDSLENSGKLYHNRV